MFISVNSVRNTGLGAREMDPWWNRHAPFLVSQSLESHQSSGRQKVKVTQLCLTLCDPMDCIHGILQARILEWVAFPFSRGLPNPGIEPRSATLLADSLPAEPQGKPKTQNFLLTLTSLVLTHYYDLLRPLCNLILPWFPIEKKSSNILKLNVPREMEIFLFLVICKWWECSQVLMEVEGKSYCPDKVTKYLWLRFAHIFHTPQVNYNLFIGR